MSDEIALKLLGVSMLITGIIQLIIFVNETRRER